MSSDGAPARGAARTNAPAGTALASTKQAVTPPTPSTSAATAAAVNATARNAKANALAVVGAATASTGSSVSTSEEIMVPLPGLAGFSLGHTARAVNHQGLFVATTISFNLAEGASLSQAPEEPERATKEIDMRLTHQGG